MCGIAGFYDPHGGFDRQNLQHMTDAIAHRGPDAEGHWLEGPVGLGHRRLSILDLSTAANQPMTSRDGRYVLVYNGEVYNYKQVARDLGLQLRTTGDTEVVLEALALEGIQAVARFNGMFAIALYDRHEQSLLLIRDRMGIKPLVYWQQGSRFAFASELKALRTLPLQMDLDVQSLQDYLFLEYVPGDRTIWQQARKLPPGHYLRVSARGVQLAAYYSVLSHVQHRQALPEQEAVALLQDRLQQAVGYCSIADVPLGTFLSGGTDSSLIAALYQAQSGQAAHTFTIGFDVPQYDESNYAEQVALQLGTRQHTTQLLLADAREHIPSLFAHYDEPFAVSGILPMLLLSQVARRQVTVALSGDGADELYMGYGYYHWWARYQRVSRMGWLGRKAVAWLLSQGDARKRRAARVFDGPGTDTDWLHVWSQQQDMFTQGEVGRLTRRPYTHSTLAADWHAIQQLPLHPWEKISLFDIRHYLANDLLYKVDIASMAHGLEVRVPYLDHQVVEHALALPLAYKYQAGEHKYLLKRLLARYLSPELVYRKKWGFPSPIREWLNGELRYLVDELLNPDHLKRQDIFDARVVQQWVSAYQSGKHPYHKNRIMALVFFQLWYRQHAG